MPHRVLDNPDDLADFTRFLGNMGLPVTVAWTKGRDRSRDQNNLMWQWATDVARQLQDRDADEVQRTWKLHHGVPILREDDPEFRALYDEALKARPYELKVKAMRIWPVTSIMSVSQMTRFLNAVQQECLQMGLQLTDPEAL